ncbi:hypothetical protein STEG23_016473 [Scotinomys teguina]
MPHPWFLDPGGWSKTAVRLYFIFPGICTLSLVYPDCLAQAIYAAFQESFPESSDLFNDEFKEDLGNTIFLWLSGLKPPEGFWTHWRLKELCTTTIHGCKRAPLKSVKQRLISSQERIASSKQN